MGRKYTDEIHELASSLEILHRIDIDSIKKTVSSAATIGLVAVASGGAKVVAEWMCRLHRSAFGSAAVAITPLEYSQISHPVRAQVILISAGGRHPDALTAAEAGRLRGDKAISALIGQADSPLERLVTNEGHGTALNLCLPPGLDGFLATNSVWISVNALYQAYAEWLPPDSIPEPTNFGPREINSWAHSAFQGGALKGMERPSYVLLHDSWTTLGADDLETRLIETSLRHVWRTDFRNLGHGRHFWLADRPSETTVIALWTPAADKLAEETLSCFPPNIQVIRVRTPLNGPGGGISSLAWSMRAVLAIGDLKGRDPGRPGVPTFGERLYGEKFTYPSRCDGAELAAEAITRKHPLSPSAKAPEAWVKAHKTAIQKFHDARFKAVVLDLDGTLIDSNRRYEPIPAPMGEQLNRLLEQGAWIGIATGRGDSAQQRLREAISDAYHTRVVIGYHNGAVIARLPEDVIGLDEDPTDPDLLTARAALIEYTRNYSVMSVRARKHQITITPKCVSSLDETWGMCIGLLAKLGLLSRLKVWRSSHSIDIASITTSKLAVVNELTSLASCSAGEVLRIGDRGAWPGNDWELLNSPIGMSVDQCSPDPETCWNFAPRGASGPRATLYFLERLAWDGDSLRLLLEDQPQ